MQFAYTLLSVLLLCPHMATAQAIEPARSQITILTRQMNVPVEAPFKKFTAQIAFDPAKPETGKARVKSI